VIDEQTLLGIAGSLIVFLITGWVWMISWMGKRWVSRLDKVEAEKANKQSTDERFDKTLQQMERHIDEDRAIHKEISDRIGKTNDVLMQIARDL